MILVVCIFQLTNLGIILKSKLLKKSQIYKNRNDFLLRGYDYEKIYCNSGCRNGGMPCLLLEGDGPHPATGGADGHRQDRVLPV